MKRIALCIITLLFAAFFAFGVFGDAAMPEYSFEPVIVNNPDGAVLYRFGYTRSEVAVVPYREELTRIFEFENDMVEFDGQYYYTVDYEGNRCFVLTSDVVAADEFVEQPQEDLMPVPNEPAMFEEPDVPMPPQMPEWPQFDERPQTSSAVPASILILLVLILLMQIAAVVLLIVLLAKRRK